VGKSTLISRISAAKPKIADYPFTTLEPNLGVVRLDDGGAAFEMVVADVPGLIEGAAEGRGLGHQFLRHIERARVLLDMVDLSPLADRGAADQLAVLLSELGEYRPDLLDRPMVVVGSRADLAAADAPAEPDLLQVSAVTGAGIPQLLGLLRVEVERSRAEEAPSEGFVTLRPAAEGVRVERRDDGSFEVLGREAMRAVALSDLTDASALEVAHQRLAALGVDRALARAGAADGDLVVIGDLRFAYETDPTVELDGGRRRGGRR
jgi:GTP-binding protein